MADSSFCDLVPLVWAALLATSWLLARWIVRWLYYRRILGVSDLLGECHDLCPALDARESRHLIHPVQAQLVVLAEEVEAFAGPFLARRLAAADEEHLCQMVEEIISFRDGFIIGQESLFSLATAVTRWRSASAELSRNMRV